MPFYGFPQKQVHYTTVFLILLYNVFGRVSIIRDTESLYLPHNTITTHLLKTLKVVKFYSKLYSYNVDRYLNTIFIRELHRKKNLAQQIMQANQENIQENKNCFKVNFFSLFVKTQNKQTKKLLLFLKK